MSGIEDVVDALGSLGKAREASLFPNLSEESRPPREKLVRIALVTDIPDDGVVRRIEYAVERYGQLDHPQIGGQMASVRLDGVRYPVSYLFREDAQLGFLKLFDIKGRMYAIQQTHVFGA